MQLDGHKCLKCGTYFILPEDHFGWCCPDCLPKAEAKPVILGVDYGRSSSFTITAKDLLNGRT